jgi:hypothetical protein
MRLSPSRLKTGDAQGATKGAPSWPFGGSERSERGG